MTPEALRALLEQVAAGGVAPGDALERLRTLPFEDLGGVLLDHHRALRLGAPEVIYGAGKTPADLAKIARAVLARGHDLLVTRVDPTQAAAILAAAPEARHETVARCVVARAPGPDGAPAARTPPAAPGARVLVVAAGTSDLPVAEEARVTAEALGLGVDLLVDVGVAGLHRLLGHLDRLRGAGVLIVVAGMEGALPSVVGGLVDRPVIAVPTSVGYGVTQGGLAALAGMLGSCAPGLVVVNVDNGFGAAFAAHRILRRRES